MKTARQAEVARLYKRGLTAAAIGRRLGVSRQRVHTLVGALGLASGWARLTQRRAVAVALAAQGQDVPAIARRLAVHPATVRRDLAKAGHSETWGSAESATGRETASITTVSSGL